MRCVFLVGVALLLVGCKDGSRGTEDVTLVNVLIPGTDQQDSMNEVACTEKVLAGKFDESSNGDCFELTPAQRWTGLWNGGYEWSWFCPAPAGECPITSDQGAKIWLHFTEAAYPKPAPSDGLYRIEFIGRRTAAPGSFGHLDQYDHLVFVERLISIRKIEESPKR